MTTLPTRFGEPISRECADKLYQKFIDIKARSVDKIRKALGDDIEAIRYYCGRPDQRPVGEDLAFIFDKRSLTQILNRILTSEADGFVVFYAVRELEGERIVRDKDKCIEFEDKKLYGRPTLMLFPCKFDALEKEGETEFKVTNILSDGQEHPGTGGRISGGGVSHDPRYPQPLPETFETADIHKFTGLTI